MSLANSFHQVATEAFKITSYIPSKKIHVKLVLNMRKENSISDNYETVLVSPIATITK